MKFAPKTQEQIADEKLLPEGIYPFEVLQADDAVSSKGNEMIKLKLSVSDENGRDWTLYDYLLEQMPEKILMFAEVTGNAERYAAGQLDAEDCDGKTGYLLLGKQAAKGGYGPKNTVKNYVPEPPEAKQVARPVRVAVAEEDVPF